MKRTPVLRSVLLICMLVAGGTVFAEGDVPAPDTAAGDTTAIDTAQVAGEEPAPVEAAPAPVKSGFQPVIVFPGGEEANPVTFGHAKHMGLGIACADCHHTSQGSKVDMGCTLCHRDQRNGKMLEAKGAFHKQCIKCHLLEATTRPDKPVPTECTACHAP